MPTMACPDSCKAMRRRSWSLITIPERTRPRRMRSRACSTCALVITSPVSCTAMIAASLSRFASSAPECPTVSCESRSRFTSGASLLRAAWIFRISRRSVAVGRGHPDDAIVAGHSVHLDEQLIERDFFFTGTIGPAATSAERIELVDEDDARGGIAGLPGELSHASRSDADVHLVEVRPGGHDHRASRFAGDGACEKRLPGAGRANEKHALRTVRSHGEEALGTLEVGDDVAQIGLRLTRTADIAKREMPGNGRRCKAVGAEGSPMMQRVAHDQRDDEQEAA